jgi:hypothetical protein
VPPGPASGASPAAEASFGRRSATAVAAVAANATERGAGCAAKPARSTRALVAAADPRHVELLRDQSGLSANRDIL